MVLKRGLRTAPCGTPASGVQVDASPRISAFRNDAISHRMEPSAIFAPRRAIIRSCGTDSKSPFRSRPPPGQSLA